MEVIIIIIFVIVIWAVANDSKVKSQEKKKKIIENRIKKGELIRLPNDIVKSPNSLTFDEISSLPDYQYLKKYGKENGIEYINSSWGFNDIKEMADIIRKNRVLIEKKQREDEFERKRIETERKKEESIRSQRADSWSRVSNRILYEINKSNTGSSNIGIYVIHCVADNRFYIGSSRNMLKRKSQHLSTLRNSKHHSYLLQEVFDKYGESNLKFYALDENKTNLLSLEQQYINIFNPPLNIEDDTKGSKHWKDLSKYSNYRKRY